MRHIPDFHWNTLDKPAEKLRKRIQKYCNNGYILEKRRVLFPAIDCGVQSPLCGVAGRVSFCIPFPCIPCVPS